MSRRLEYKTDQTKLDNLEDLLNDYAQEGFKALHFHHPGPDSVFVVLGRKHKHDKHHHHDEYDEEGGE